MNVAGGRRASRAGLSLVLLLAVLVGCSGGPSADTASSAAVQRVLDRRAAAVLDRDVSAYRATGDPSAASDEFANLREVPLAAWSYHLDRLTVSGDRATARVQLRYRIEGYDTAPVTAGRTLGLTRTAGTWHVDSDEPTGGSGRQLWEQGAVAVARGKHSLVLGVGQSGERLRSFAALADHAVPAVSRAWGPDWAGHVVVLVPKSLDGMAGLLGAPAAGYRGIAAVTTGEVGVPRRRPRTGSSSTRTRTASSATSASRSCSPTRARMSRPAPAPRPPPRCGSPRGTRTGSATGERADPRAGRLRTAAGRRGRAGAGRPARRQGLRVQR